VALALVSVGGIAHTFWPRGPSADRIESLAVLPLTNRSPDQQPDYFVDGMTEALVTDLASLSGVRVIARQSVLQYRNSGKPASTIARELKADALVEGAVQRSGQRVRVDIRLIDGTTSRAIWATAYERDVGDALELQAEISRAIVNELHLTLEPSQRARLANRRPSNQEAWDAYLKARFFWNKRTHSDMSRAIEWYERAIQRDPSFAMGYAGLADVYATLGPPNTAISELIARGTTAAEKAIELDPTLGEPYAALGKLRAYAWDWHGAESNYRKAIERAPGYAPARYWFGLFLANQGRCDEAFLEAREAERLDPVSMPGNMVVSSIELRCNRVEQAITRSLTIVEFDSKFASSFEFLGRAYMQQAKVQDAIPMLDRALELSGDKATVLAMRGYAYAAAGRIREAEAVASELAARHERDKLRASAWSVAIAHAGLRRDEATLAWLEHAYADREEWLEALAADERFRHLHRDPRFQRLLNRLGLPNELPGVLTRW
jgi:TolB-like protein/Tfp pilus assembly protein PilF